MLNMRKATWEVFILWRLLCTANELRVAWLWWTSALRYIWKLFVLRVSLDAGCSWLLFLLLLSINLLLQLYDTYFDPRVLESLLRSQSFINLPLKALIYEVNKQIIIAFHHQLQLFRVGLTHSSFWICILKRSVIVIKKYFSSCGLDNHRSWWNSFYFHYALNLFFFIFTRKYRKTNIQLVQNASQRPHINCWSISYSHHDFWRSIKPTLNICVKLIRLIGSTSKINNFDPTLIRLPEEYILWLHITMNDIMLTHIMQRHKQLNSKSPDQTNRYALEVVAFNEFVKVHA